MKFGRNMRYHFLDGFFCRAGMKQRGIKLFQLKRFALTIRLKNCYLFGYLRPPIIIPSRNNRIHHSAAEAYFPITRLAIGQVENDGLAEGKSPHWLSKFYNNPLGHAVSKFDYNW